jgi:hypothetical protein
MPARTPKTAVVRRRGRRLAMLCPCCGGEVTHRRYAFSVVTHESPNYSVFFVCDACESALSGSDPAARAACEDAFVAHLELRHAPAP